MVLGKQTTFFCFGSELLKEVNRSAGNMEDRRLALARQRSLRRPISGGTLQRAGPVAYGLECRPGRGELKLREHRGFGVNRNHARGIFVGKRTQEHRIHHTEDGSIRANAERQGKHGHGGQSGILSQHAEAEAHILEKSF